LNFKNRQQLLIVLAVGVVALFAADKIIFTPLIGAWKSRSKQIDDLRSQVAHGQSLIRRDQSLREHWDRMQTNALPANRSLAEQRVTEAFERWAQDSRISLTSVSPQWKDTEDYSTLQCRIEANANLEAVRRFLYDMEKDPMALRLETVEVSARDPEGQQLSLGLQVSGLVLQAPSRNQP
jgi:hypothetical protein